MEKLDSLKSGYKGGKVSRRQFMEGALALGMTVATASAFVSDVQAMTPKKGGNMKFGIGAGSTTDSLDPGTTSDTYMQLTNYGLRSHLTEIGKDGKIQGDVAESYEASPDAKVWTFKLRKGVEFHSGKSLDAEDVVASFNHHRGDDTKSAAKGVLASVESIKADGKDTVVFTLKEGSADFPYAASDYHITMLPSKDGKVSWEKGEGTGAYILENYEPGVKTVMKRNPNYWKEGAGNFDSVEILAIKDVVARTNALTSGEIHAMDRCDLKTVHLLKRNKAIRVEQETGTQHYSIPMITTGAPYDNNDVRLALKYAIDREAMVKTILRGYGEVANDHPISPSQQFFNKDLPIRAYDPDKAKFHMKKAGVDSLKLDLSASDAAFGGAVDAAVLYKEHAAKAGIDINVVRESSDGYWSNVWMKKPWCMCYWGGRPTQDWMFSIAYAKGANWNDTFWEHERFNTLLKEARAELDPAKREGRYFEMQQIVRDDGGVVIPMYASYVFAMSTKVAEGQRAANWDMDGNKAAERWWFA